LDIQVEVRRKTTLKFNGRKRESRLILNLVDVEDPAYIAKEIMDEALQFIDQSLEAGRKVLVPLQPGDEPFAGDWVAVSCEGGDD